MEKSPALSQLTKLQLEKLADNLKIQNYKKGDVVFKAGEVVSQKWIVLHQGILKEVCNCLEIMHFHFITG